MFTSQRKCARQHTLPVCNTHDSIGDEAPHPGSRVNNKTKTKQTQSEWRGRASSYWPPLCAQSRCGKYQPIEMVALPLPPAGIRIVTAVAPIGAASATIRPGRLPQSVPPVLNSAQRSDSVCAVQYVGCGGGGSGGCTFETSAEPPPSRADRSDAAHMERLPACA